MERSRTILVAILLIVAFFDIQSSFAQSRLRAIEYPKGDKIPVPVKYIADVSILSQPAFGQEVTVRKDKELYSETAVPVFEKMALLEALEIQIGRGRDKEILSFPAGTVFVTYVWSGKKIFCYEAALNEKPLDLPTGFHCLWDKKDDGSLDSYRHWGRERSGNPYDTFLARVYIDKTPYRLSPLQHEELSSDIKQDQLALLFIFFDPNKDTLRVNFVTNNFEERYTITAIQRNNGSESGPVLTVDTTQNYFWSIRNIPQGATTEIEGFGCKSLVTPKDIETINITVTIGFKKWLDLSKDHSSIIITHPSGRKYLRSYPLELTRY